MDKLKETSIIIPFYKKYKEFVIALKYNSAQFELAGEVIFVIDEPIDITSFHFLQDYNINFIFYMNTETHPWRNPAVVINKGIASASKKYCIIISPESLLLELTLLKLVLNTDEDTFSVGNVLFTTYALLDTCKYDFNYILPFFKIKDKKVIKHVYGPVNFGSICCTKENFIKVGCYSENFSLLGWGGEDDEVRVKLEQNNINKFIIKSPTLIHPEHQHEFNNRLTKNYTHKKIINNKLFNNFIKVSIGKEVIEPIIEPILVEPILEPITINHILTTMREVGKIIDYECHVKPLQKHYPIMLLAQCYNEEANVQAFLNNVAHFVDGMLILDDGSTDNTWALLQHDALVLKVKKPRTAFNDLENRNLLLHILEKICLKNHIKVDWFVWLDFDERLTTNMDFLQSTRNLLLADAFKYDNVNLPLFHMWNETMYNADYPFSEQGLQYKLRLIRNRLDKLPYILKSSTTLHFPLSPYKSSMTNINLQIKHLSYVTKEARQRKYDLYTKTYDVQRVQKNYAHFLKDDVKLLLYDELMEEKKTLY